MCTFYLSHFCSVVFCSPLSSFVDCYVHRIFIVIFPFFVFNFCCTISTPPHHSLPSWTSLHTEYHGQVWRKLDVRKQLPFYTLLLQIIFLVFMQKYWSCEYIYIPCICFHLFTKTICLSLISPPTYLHIVVFSFFIPNGIFHIKHASPKVFFIWNSMIFTWNVLSFVPWKSLVRW